VERIRHKYSCLAGESLRWPGCGLELKQCCSSTGVLIAHSTTLREGQQLQQQQQQQQWRQMESQLKVQRTKVCHPAGQVSQRELLLWYICATVLSWHCPVALDSSRVSACAHPGSSCWAGSRTQQLAHDSNVATAGRQVQRTVPLLQIHVLPLSTSCVAIQYYRFSGLLPSCGTQMQRSERGGRTRAFVEGICHRGPQMQHALAPMWHTTRRPSCVTTASGH
jgi:hypothetical protein